MEDASCVLLELEVIEELFLLALLTFVGEAGRLGSPGSASSSITRPSSSSESSNSVQVFVSSVSDIGLSTAVIESLLIFFSGSKSSAC